MSDNTIKFSFGDPESVTDSHLLDYLGTFTDPHGEYYVPPISLSGLSKMRRANGHHGSAIVFRRNMTANAYVNNDFFPVGGFRNAHTDLLTYGTAYVQKIFNGFGRLMRLQHLPGLNMRRKTDGTFCMLLPNFQKQDFMPGEVIQIMEYDTQQQIYGIPDWIGGLQSALLNQDATLFRRKYYKNGAHLGYIFYTNDQKLDPEDEEGIKRQIEKGKGAGNFRTMYLHVPGGNEKGVQIIPIGDISQKDEFQRIKNISANDVLAAHRTPPALMGIAAENTGGFGDPEKIERVYIRTEVQAMAQPWLDLNAQLPSYMQFEFNFNTEATE